MGEMHYIGTTYGVKRVEKLTNIVPLLFGLNTLGGEPGRESGIQGFHRGKDILHGMLDMTDPSLPLSDNIRS
ncbi:hypothetical protein CEXT_805651 [Caerostris extrusa]|uniref:Uncharacterized protein n=1 Tax=Caerostris extrusa TaxID=172846 RepID=A0AAV4WEY0_CAEEX|nr:hypothetical protein CEXT_805651 [Caerostris extrusa]